MGDKSKIEWTDATWNTAYGCTRASEGCDNCYAVKVTQRLAGQHEAARGLVNPGKKHFNGVVRRMLDRLDQPLRWKRPRRIFVNSLSDLFHPNVPFGFIDKVFAVMALCPQHTFQVLTKRPERQREYLSQGGIAGAWVGEMELMGLPFISPDALADEVPLPNVWLGTSVENQETADERVPHLLQTPAAVRWLSMEPLLGPVDLAGTWGYPGSADTETLESWPIHWVVAGGESGPKARPMHPYWVRSIRDQCQAAGVPFLFKQWGAWAFTPSHGMRVMEDDGVLSAWRTVSSTDRRAEGKVVYHAYPKGITEKGVGPFEKMERVGKKAAGRELDGRTWDEFPE
jgi:protein gp37